MAAGWLGFALVTAAGWLMAHTSGSPGGRRLDTHLDAPRAHWLNSTRKTPDPLLRWPHCRRGFFCFQGRNPGRSQAATIRLNATTAAPAKNNVSCFTASLPQFLVGLFVNHEAAPQTGPSGAVLPISGAHDSGQ